jgi:hypothetical protein
LLLDKGKTTKNKMLTALTEENSPFINEGKNILIEEFATDYVTNFSILTCIASGMKTRAEIAISQIRATYSPISGTYLEIRAFLG